MKVRKFLIVGVDPGVTTGLCIVDLQGNYIYSESSRQLDLKELIKRISQFGIPVLVACDVNPAPKLVEKVAAKFQAKLFVPEENLSVRLKKSLTRGMEIKNDHERDAVASAFFAFKKHRSLFEKVDRELSNLGEEERELVKKKMLSGEIPSIKAYLESKERVPGVAKQEKKIKRRKAAEEEKEIATLRTELKFLRKRVKELEEENERLKALIQRIPRAERRGTTRYVEISSLRQKIRELTEKLTLLEGEVDRYKRELKVLKNGYLLVREVEEVSREVGKYEGDVLLVREIKNLDEGLVEVLKSFPLLIVDHIDPKSEEILLKHNIRFVLREYIRLERVSGLLCVRRDEVEKKREIKEILKEIIEKYRKERKANP